MNNSEDMVVGSGSTAISWTASEFLDHQKATRWFVLLGAAVAAAALAALLITRDVFSIIAVVVLGVLFGVSASKKPRVREYVLDESGLLVDGRHYPFEDFSSFFVAREGFVESIVLVPARRFATELTVYFDPDTAQKIFDMLSAYIPFEERKKDAVDSLLHHIKF